MLDIVASNRFKKDLKLALKRGYRISLMEDVVNRLAAGETLAEKYRDHLLTGDYGGFRECHITPDWLLVYQIRKMNSSCSCPGREPIVTCFEEFGVMELPTTPYFHNDRLEKKARNLYNHRTSRVWSAYPKPVHTGDAIWIVSEQEKRI